MWTKRDAMKLKRTHVNKAKKWYDKTKISADCIDVWCRGKEKEIDISKEVLCCENNH